MAKLVVWQAVNWFLHKQALSRHATAGPKQASQEQLSDDREGLTYNQIRLIIGMKQRGMRWDDHIVQNPAAQVSRAPMPQPAAVLDSEDDGPIPF